MFERHVFISYAHIDNQPLTPDQLGWVSLFHATLQTMLSQQLGARADIWRDDKLRGSDVFGDEILQQFPRTAVMVSVLSPRYLRSEWCTREIREFSRLAAAGLTVDNKSRVIKVVKTPVDLAAPLPGELDRTLGYEFFEYDAHDHTPRELDPAFGEHARQEFLRKTHKLAWDIADLLGRLRKQAAQTPTASPDPPAAAPRAGSAATTVYLAECSRDLRTQREMLEAELRCAGHEVLPQERLPDDEGDYRAAVAALLARAQLAVHLVGSAYGRVPDGPSGHSINMIQLELAQAAGLPRVIWLPPAVQGESPAQQAWIEALRRDAALLVGAERVGGDFETLKSVVLAASRPRPAAVAAPRNGAAVYLLCEARDRREVLPLVKRLRARGLEVRLPVFSGEAAALREAHRELVASSDAILLYYGAADEAWKFHQHNELRKLGGLARERPLAASLTLLAPPRNEDKELLLALEEPDLIDALDGLEALDEARLAPLFDALAHGAGNA